MQPKRTKHKS